MILDPSFGEQSDLYTDMHTHTQSTRLPAHASIYCEIIFYINMSTF